MKKIFSIICAVAVALSLPLLAFDPIAAQAYEVVVPPVQLNLNDNIGFEFNKALSSASGVNYMRLNAPYLENALATYTTYRDFSYNGVSSTYMALFDGVRYTEQITVGQLYHLTQPVSVDPVNFTTTLIGGVGFYDGTGAFIPRLLFFVVPTQVPLTTEIPYQFKPFSVDNVFDLFIAVCSGNSSDNVQAVASRYYPYAYTLIRGRLYATTFLRDGYIVKYQPFISTSLDVGGDGEAYNYYGVVESNCLLNDLLYENTTFVAGDRSAGNNGEDLVCRVYDNQLPLLTVYNDFIGLDSLSSYGAIVESLFYSRLDLSLSSVDAYQSGYNEGYAVGYEYGRITGDGQGFDRGYNEGYNDGKADGLDLSGINGIKAQEYNRGFIDGLALAEGDGGGFGFISLLTTIADSQLALLTSFLDFNFLGWNMLTFFKSLLTLCIVVMIIKFVI